MPQGWILDLIDIEDPIEQFETLSRVARTAERLDVPGLARVDGLEYLGAEILPALRQGDLPAPSTATADRWRSGAPSAPMSWP